MRFWTFASIVLLALASSSTAHPPGDDHENHADGDAPPQFDGPRFVTSRQGPDLPLPEEDDAFLFVIFGDRTGGSPEGVEVLAEAVDDVNLLGPDLVVTVGDLIQGYNQTDEWLEQMREYKHIMNTLECPWFPVAGNHDVYWRGPNRPDGEHESSYETHFGPLWYAFRHKDCWFIVLYSDEGNPETGEKSFGDPAAQQMSDEQFNWLADTLQRTSDAQHVFVFLHHPRWLGANYGNDWTRVHDLLAGAGNVRAVFAGHIHEMRYDGRRDGIVYVTLATVGGGQSGAAPEAGYLHEFHIVTVRKDSLHMAAVPVGEVMDVRAITGTVSRECRQLADVRPTFDRQLRVDAAGLANSSIEITIDNPVSRPIEAMVALTTDDSRWSFLPDHNHRIIPAGSSHTFDFDISRVDDALDDTFRPVDVLLDIDYLGKGARFSIPTSTTQIPLRPMLPEPTVPDTEMVAEFDGEGDFLRVQSKLINLRNGPFTLECWFNADAFGSRTGLITKTENSEYGFFVSDGTPSFFVHLDGAYVTAAARSPILEPDRWYHLAGVFDGEQVRLYLDGELIDSTSASGIRTPNRLPLLVGADVGGNGEAMSFFDGRIDAVRLSDVARYRSESFEPARRPSSDEHTLLLLNMDGSTARWVYDGSPFGAHPTRHGDVELTDDVAP